MDLEDMTEPEIAFDMVINDGNVDKDVMVEATNHYGSVMANNGELNHAEKVVVAYTVYEAMLDLAKADSKKMFDKGIEVRPDVIADVINSMINVELAIGVKDQ